MVVEVALLITPSCMASTVHSLLDTFCCANFFSEKRGDALHFNVSLVSCDGKSVTATNGYEFNIDLPAQSAVGLDVVILAPPSKPFAKAEEIKQYAEPMELLHPWLNEQSKQGVIVASSCCGSFFLAEVAHDNSNQEVTITHRRSSFSHGGHLPDAILQKNDLITENGKLVFSGGILSNIDLALHLIQRFGGGELASKCNEVLTANNKFDNKSHNTPCRAAERHPDDLVKSVQSYLERNYPGKIDIKFLADKFSVNERTLKRRFVKATGLSIGNYLRIVRLKVAQDRLISSNRSLRLVVEDVGYEDVSSFNRLFKKETGYTMKAYRENFKLR